MAQKQYSISVSGFTDGLNTDASVLKILPSEMMEGTKNIELLSNGAVRPRRGLSFLGTNEVGDYFNTLELQDATPNVQLAPNIVYARLPSPTGTVLSLVIEFINGVFNIYDANITSLTKLTPKQVITPVLIHPNQKYFNIDLKVGQDKVFFAGRHIHPGYLQVSNSDQNALQIVHYDVLMRRKVNTGLGKRVKVNGVGYESIEEHLPSNYVADQSKPGEGTNWRRYWHILENYNPTDFAAWSAGDPAYVTSFEKRYNQLVTPTSTMTYPTTVELYAGRVWLAGDPKYPNTLYFTQVIQSNDYYHRFHSFADPFDPEDPDIVASDGGVIETPECGIIYQLVAEEDALHYGASNKVFYISGGAAGFAATDFVNKESISEGILGFGSMVRTDDSVLIFAESSIYKSDRSQGSYQGQITFESMTAGRLQGFYSKISPVSKSASKAVYNSGDKKVYWFYTSDANNYFASYNLYRQHGYFTNCIVFDTNKPLVEGDLRRTTGLTFSYYEYPYGVNDNIPFIACPFSCVGLGGTQQEVVALEEEVLAGSEQVTVFINFEENRAREVIFTTIKTGEVSESVTTVLVDAFEVYSDADQVVLDDEITQSFAIQRSFARLGGDLPYDWPDSEYESEFESKLYTGIQTGGNILATKNHKYLYFVFKRVESGFLDNNGEDITPGSCLVYTATQFATGNNTGKWVGPREVYKPDRYQYTPMDGSNPDHSHVWFKHKVRGRGNVFQVVITNNGKKDFNLIGWTQSFGAKI